MGNQQNFPRFLGSLWLLSLQSQKNEKQPGRAGHHAELPAGAPQRCGGSVDKKGAPASTKLLHHLQPRGHHRALSCPWSFLSPGSSRCPRTRLIRRAPPPPSACTHTHTHPAPCPPPKCQVLTFTWAGRSPTWRMLVGSSPAAEPLSAPSPLAMTRGPRRLLPGRRDALPPLRPPLGPDSGGNRRRHSRRALAKPAGRRQRSTLPCTPPRTS